MNMRLHCRSDEMGHLPTSVPKIRSFPDPVLLDLNMDRTDDNIPTPAPTGIPCESII